VPLTLYSTRHFRSGPLELWCIRGALLLQQADQTRDHRIRMDIE
jgi:hypothetical protein